MRQAEAGSAPTATDPRRWVVLVGLMLTYAATNGILVHTLPLAYPHLIETFGWTQSQVTLPATVFLVVAALTSPPAGALLDRYSARLIIAIGLLALVGGLFAHAKVTSLSHLVGVYVVFALGLSLCGLVSNMLILSRWFERDRGRATGLLLMSSSVGGALFPWLLGYFLANQGWRFGMQAMAVATALLALLPIALLVRDWPRGSARAQAYQATTKPSGGAVTDAAGPTLRQALREPRFYLIALATGSVWFAVLAMLQHQSIYLVGDIGVDKARLPMVFSTFFACSVIGKLLFGWLSDHVDKTTMMLASIVTLATGLLLLRYVGVAGNYSLFAYAMVAGVGFSGAFTMIQLLFATIYAGASFGKILAILMMVDTLSGALGTRVLGRMREATGSYLPGIDLMIGLLVVAFVAIVIATRRQGLSSSEVTG